MIKSGDHIIRYDLDFNIFKTKKLRNPPEVAKFAAEVQEDEKAAKVSFLSFFVTPEALEEQLLGIVAAEERQDLANMENQMVVSSPSISKKLVDIEENILFILSNSQGNIVDEEQPTDMLPQSKITSNIIAAKFQEYEKAQNEEIYRPVAIRASLLFFCMSDLASVDPMCQYSLGWFIALFVRGIREAPQAKDIKERGENSNEYSPYANVCQSLFEKHKLIFSLLLCVRMMKQNGKILEWRFLLIKPTSSEVMTPNPASEWLTEESWAEILNLSKLPNFQGFDTHFTDNILHYKNIFDDHTHEFNLASPWNDKLETFQKILVLRCLRPDKLVMGFPNFGMDMGDWLKLGEEMFIKKFGKVPLGKGQETTAERLLIQGSPLKTEVFPPLNLNVETAHSPCEPRHTTAFDWTDIELVNEYTKLEDELFDQGEEDTVSQRRVVLKNFFFSLEKYLLDKRFL
ncbi:hypothetical protein BSKO_05770 [Bryopsis sp. KO-2023]|nr:hypothetical protein BSKO_05770 [Bryopsis sp. KO-2023]